MLSSPRATKRFVHAMAMQKCLAKDTCLILSCRLGHPSSPVTCALSILQSLDFLNAASHRRPGKSDGSAQAQVQAAGVANVQRVRGRVANAVQQPQGRWNSGRGLTRRTVLPKVTQLSRRCGSKNTEKRLRVFQSKGLSWFAKTITAASGFVPSCTVHGERTSRGAFFLSCHALFCFRTSIAA